MWTRILIFKHFLLHLKRTFGNFAKMIALMQCSPFFLKKNKKMLNPLLPVDTKRVGRDTSPSFFPFLPRIRKIRNLYKNLNPFWKPLHYFGTKILPLPPSTNPRFWHQVAVQKNFFFRERSGKEKCNWHRFPLFSNGSGPIPFGKRRGGEGGVLRIPPECNRRSTWIGRDLSEKISQLEASHLRCAFSGLTNRYKFRHVEKNHPKKPDIPFVALCHDTNFYGICYFLVHSLPPGRATIGGIRITNT